MKERVRQKAFTRFLENYITDHKKNLINEVLEYRTRHVTVVLEDIYQPHNASAVVRTCDCFGVQDLHIIENHNTYEINPDVVLGASKWVNIIRHNQGQSNTQQCYKVLKEKNYRLVATSPRADCPSIHELDPKAKTALIFGTELTGLSDFAMDNADQWVRIPMYGFTESYNISVSVAICLSVVMEKLFSSNMNWRLSEWEKEEIRLAWYKRIVKRWEALEREFLRSQENKN